MIKTESTIKELRNKAIYFINLSIKTIKKTEDKDVKKDLYRHLKGQLDLANSLNLITPNEWLDTLLEHKEIK